jgi:hypothetical protein
VLKKSRILFNLGEKIGLRKLYQKVKQRVGG